MKYRCLTCGFSQDFVPTPDSVQLHHPWMAGVPVDDCPACTDYLQRGGRKNGKIRMPHFEKVGRLIEETEEVSSKLKELNADSALIALGDEATTEKYKGERIFGYSPEEIQELNKK